MSLNCDLCIGARGALIVSVGVSPVQTRPVFKILRLKGFTKLNKEIQAPGQISNKKKTEQILCEH